MVNKKIFGFLFVFCAVVFVNVLAVDYNITTCEELQNMSLDLSGNYQLMNDIDCSDTINWNSGLGFQPVGNSSYPFTGNLNGNGYYISDLYENIPDEVFNNDAGGLFGRIRGAVITNTRVIDANITADGDTGILVGFASGSGGGNTVVGCSVSGVVRGNGDVGGFIGTWDFGNILIDMCSADVFVDNSAHSSQYIGGFIGGAYSPISNSYATGNVLGNGNEYSYGGGFVSSNGPTIISNSYSTGNVSNSEYNGGFSGWLDSLSVTNNCFSTGIVSEGNSGGFAGYFYSGGEYGAATGSNNMFYSLSTTNAIGYDSQTSLPIATLDEISFGSGVDGVLYFYNRSDSPMSSWDFNGIWLERQNSFPALRWQVEPVYNITNCQELQDMNLDLAGNYQLMNDVDCFGFDFEPVGNLANPFSGVLDGKNKTISNLIINLPESNYTGLFGVASGDILNINLDDASITGAEFVGVLMGFQDGGIISNSHASGEVNSYVVDGDVGGLVGQLNSGEISNSSFSGNVNAVIGNAIGGLVGFQQTGTIISRSYFSGIVYGEASVGGLVGAQFGGTISSSYSGGNSNVIATGYSVGGLVGWKNNGVILNSYSGINVDGGNEVGGLVGRQDGGSIENSYSIGSVSGTLAIGDEGGFLGLSSGGTVVNSYWDMETSWRLASKGTEIGKTSEEMRALYTYNFFGGEWNISGGADNLNNGYPYLSWQAGSDESVWVIPSTKSSFFAGGMGTVGNPYQISSWEELNYVRNNLSAHYALIANLSAGTEGYSGLGSSWQPIGNHSAYNDEEFSGTFDGMNNTISDVVINLNKWQVALFDSTTASASISNLGLINFNVQGGESDTATLVGYNSATIINVYARGGSVLGSASVGGLIGDCGGSSNVISNVWTDISVSGLWNVGGIGGDVFQPIENSYSLGSVSGENNVGGIYGGTVASVKNCYSSSAITATRGGYGVAGGGGILGRTDGSTLIENCYFNGTINGDFSGGLVADNSGIIKNCYSNATITGEANGGIVGIQRAGTINNSFSASRMVTSGADFINGGFVGLLSGVDVGSIKNSGWIKTDETLFAIGMDENSMLPIEDITYNETNVSVFYGSLHPIYSSWNFSDVWTEDPLGFPKLNWENFERDMISPQISFYNNTSNGSLAQNWIFANVSVSDLNLNGVVIYLYNETSLINASAGNPNFFINFSGLSYGNYFLNASANDTFGNTNYTITYNITLQNPATCSDGIQNQDETDIDCGGSCDVCSAEGGSSGGSGRGVSNYNLTDLQLFDGVSKLLNIKDKIIFNVSNQTHTLTLRSFNNQGINVTIESTPKNYVINLGQTISVDVSGDGVADVDLSYEKYSLGSAQIGIRMAKLINTGDNVQADVEDVGGDRSVVGRFFDDGEFRAKALLVVSVVLLILIILFFILILSVFRRSR